MAVIKKSRDGNVVLLYRGDSPNVFCRLKKPDVSGWVRRGTGITDVDTCNNRPARWTRRGKRLKRSVQQTATASGLPEAPNCLVPIDFLIVSATVEENSNDGDSR